MVPTAHIDALIEAGLWHAEKSRCRFTWFYRRPNEDEQRDAYQRGEVWGPGAGEVAGNPFDRSAPEFAVVGHKA